MSTSANDHRASNADAAVVLTGVGHALHAEARREVDALLRALDNRRSRHRGVHEARKAIRRLRSLIELGRPAFRRSANAVSGELKLLAESLSELRDAHVLYQSATRRCQRAKHHDERRRWAALREQLDVARQTTLTAVLTADPDFRGRKTEVNRILVAVDALPWATVDVDIVERALQRSVDRAHRAEQRAEREGASEDDRHRWRRRLRRLRMQWGAIKSLRDDGAPALRAEAKRLLAWLDAEAPSLDQLKRRVDRLGQVQDRTLLHAAAARLENADAKS